MYEVQRDDIAYQVYVVLENMGVRVSGVQAADIVVRYTLAGGPLTLDVLTIADWQEIDPLDAPGLYVLTFLPAWVAAEGPLFVRLSPLVPSTFDAVEIQARVVPLTLEDLQTSLVRLLGLSQENFRMDDHVYNQRGELVSARVALYASAADTLSNTSPTAEYAVAASYDGQGRLIQYTMTQI